MKPYLLVLFSLFFVQDILAQWTKHYEHPDPGSSSFVIYFLHEQGAPRLGFAIFSNQNHQSSTIHRTSDGGETWQEVPAGVNFLWGVDICFMDSLRGWCALAGTTTLIETTDGGLTWSPCGQPSPDCIIHALNWRGTTGYLLASVYTSTKETCGVYRSTDFGKTWLQTLQSRAVGMAFSNSGESGIVSGAGDETESQEGQVYQTNDEGITWTHTGEFEAWQPAWSEKTQQFFAISELGAAERTTQIKSPTGAWEQVSSLPNTHLLTGTVRTNNCYAYTQTSRQLLRTNLKGLDWISIGGPGNYRDTRFYVHDNIVWALEGAVPFNNIRGSIWRYIEPYEFSFKSQLNITGCKLDTSIQFSYNADCFDGELISAELMQPDDRFILGSMNLPQRVSGEFGIPLHYSSSVPGATDNASLKIRFRAGAYTFDTVIAITANSGAGVSKVGFELRPTNTSPKPGELTTIGVYPTAATTSAELTDLSFDLSYLDDLFALKNVRSVSGVNFTPSVVSGKQTAAIALSSPDIKLDPNTPVAEIDLEARLTDTVSSDVTISNIKLNNGDVDYARCKLSLDESSGTALSVTLACGDPLIQRVIRGERALAIKSITPNPTNGKLTINYESKFSGEVMLSVYSVNGVVIHEEVVHSAGKPIQLDTSGWPSGAYTIVLRSGDDEARGTAIKE